MNLPLLPTTGVGSWPKPEYVTEAKGRLNEGSKRATEEFIRLQEALGITVKVDGEFFVGDMATDYARELNLPIADWTRSYDNRYWKKGMVDRPLERQIPIKLEQFEYAQSLTDGPVKGMLTGPTTLANWLFNSHYRTREELVYAWAEIIKQEALALERAGAKFIQIDEPAVGERHWEGDLFKEALRRVTDGLRAYTITHVCYGDFGLVYPRMRELPVNQVDIELSSELDLGPERSRILGMMREDPLTKYKDISIGVIDVRPGVPVETLDTVVRRIHTALNVLAPTEQELRKIWIDPDCGFRTTKDPEVAYRKLKVITEAVEQVRQELGTK